MKIFSSLSLVALMVVPSANGMDFLTQASHQLEHLYFADCEADPTPRGYYGAFLQPCTFEFRQTTGTINRNDDGACSDDSSTLMSKPVPMHWFFNLTAHFDEDDWDKISSDDIPATDQLMLWPDQCVGATPRCYFLDFANADIRDTLAKLFPDSIPEAATHVRVDCRGDAVALSRVLYSLASGLEKSSATIIAWLVTVVLFSLVALVWCIYGCTSLFCSLGRRSSSRGGYVPLVAQGKVVHPSTVDYVLTEEGGFDKTAF